MMVIDNIATWQTTRQGIEQPQSVGFVATMGCLHQGHAALLQQSLQDNDVTVLSIFVNPMQFNRADDFKKYPNTLDQDIHLATSLGVDYVFTPSKAEVYPEGDHMKIHCDDPNMMVLEGEHRPGHFDGVLTIMMKLFNLVLPARAYFGDKDFQQCQLMKSLVKYFFMPIEIVVCPTQREASGLPRSSRNARLSAAQKRRADKFSLIFHKARPDNLAEMKQQLLDADIAVEYLEVRDNQIFTGVSVDGIRLIDHLTVGENIIC